MNFLNNSIRAGLVCSISGLSLLAADPCLAQNGAVIIDRVLAVEEARSPLGEYRIVFTTAAPVPAPTDTFLGMAFSLGNQGVRFSPMAPRTTLHYGYFNQIPEGNIELRVREVTIGGKSEAPVLSRVTLNPSAELAKSRPAKGGFESVHIVRSAGNTDIWQAWSNSDVAFTGTLMREDEDPEHKGTWRLFFQPDQVMKGGDRIALPNLVILNVDGLRPWHELGGKYLVCGKMNGEELNAAIGAHSEVRLWWPDNDDVLDFVSKRSAMGEQPEAAALRTLLVDSLQNPAIEVRFTAATQLEVSASDLITPESAVQVKATVQSRLESEPAPAVQTALKSLLDSRTLRTRTQK